MEKPISFTLQRFLQINAFDKTKNTYPVNWSFQKHQCTLDTSSDESLPNKGDTFRHVKRRKTNFELVDEFQCFKSIRSPAKSSKFPEASFPLCNNLRNKYQFKPSNSLKSKRPRPLAGTNQDTKEFNDFLERHSQYIDENKLFKACKSYRNSAVSQENSAINLNEILFKPIISDNRKRTLSIGNTDFNVTSSSTMGFKSGLKNSFDGRPGCNKPCKTTKLDEFLETYSHVNNVSSSFESLEKPKTEGKQFPLGIGGSQKSMFSFFKKSKKYDKHPYGSPAETGGGKSAAPAYKETPDFVDKENRPVWKRKGGTIKPDSIWKEHKRKLEKPKHPIKKRISSDSSEDSIRRKAYSRKPFKSMKTETSPIRNRISRPKNIQETCEVGCFPVGKSPGPELQMRNIQDIWDAPNNAIKASILNLGLFESTEKSKKHKKFLRKSSSESNLIKQRENKPVPKLTFKKEGDSPVNDKFRFSSVENVRKTTKENPTSRGSKECIKNTEDSQKIAASNSETLLKSISNYIEYTTPSKEKNIESSAEKSANFSSFTGQNVSVPTKSHQKKLLSSEGFHESMSTETPIRNSTENIVKTPEAWTNNNEKLAIKSSSVTIHEGNPNIEDVYRDRNAFTLDRVGLIPSMENICETTPSFKRKPLNATSTSSPSATLGKSIQDSLLPKANDSLSDPISLGSQSVAGSHVQVQSIVTVEKADSGQNNSLTPNTQTTQQKKDKFDSQALKDLCSIHERNKWEQNFSVQNTNLTEKDTNKSSVIIKGNYLVQRHHHQLSFSQLSSDNALNSSQLQKTSVSGEVPPSMTDDLDDNHQTNEDDPYLLRDEQNMCHTQDNYYEESSSNLLTEVKDVTQTQTSSTQQESAPKTKIYVRKKAYNITEDCILFGDHLLKELLEERPRIFEAYNKNKAKLANRKETDDILAKTYIKRYKKGQTKIFKIKRRLKVTQDEIYRRPEDHIIDRFTEKLHNDFQDEPSSEKEDGDSVSTPSSYVTVSDETKSEPLSTGSAKLPKYQKLLREGVNKLSKNGDLLFSRYSDSAPKNFDSTATLNRIYEMLLEILEDYEEGREPFLKIPKNIVRNYVFRGDRYQLAGMVEYTAMVYKPNRKQPRFSLRLFVLNKIRNLLETGTKLTKRELYYHLRTMIYSEPVVSRAIHDISRILNVGVWALNITSQKGLVYGNLKLTMNNGEIINCNVAGTTVPKDVMDICEIQSDAYFILVVEKESVFHKLLEEDLPRRLTRPFIMITGKGFPDLNTQLFLKKLWMVMTIPVFILVDADPDGVAIMLNYRFGSIANAHVSEHLAIPKARWIGVFPSEINKLRLTYETLSKREITKTQQLLKLHCVQRNEKIKEQLQTLLETESKAGIESVMKTDTYLSHRYLSTKFFVNDLI